MKSLGREGDFEKTKVRLTLATLSPTDHLTSDQISSAIFLTIVLRAMLEGGFHHANPVILQTYHLPGNVIVQGLFSNNEGVFNPSTKTVHHRASNKPKQQLQVDHPFEPTSIDIWIPKKQSTYMIEIVLSLLFYELKNLDPKTLYTLLQHLEVLVSDNTLNLPMIMENNPELAYLESHRIRSSN